MEKERLSIDYDGEKYRLRTPGSIMYGDNSVQELTIILLAECQFGVAIRKDEPVYELCFSSQARKSLDKSRVEVLKAIVSYHNQIVDECNKFKLR